MGIDLIVSGGRGLSHFGGQMGTWLAVNCGGRPAEKWRPDAVAISLERRGPKDKAADTRRPGEE